MSAYKGDQRAIEMTRLRDSGLSWPEIGRRYGVDKATAHSIVKRWRGLTGEEPPIAPAPRDQVTVTDGPEGRVLDSPSSGRIKTLDQLLAAAEVDLERWRVDRHVVNKWEVAAADGDGGLTVQDLWQVKAWLSPRVDVLEARALAAEIIAEMGAHAPVYTRPTYDEPAGERHLLEVCLMDLHAGMYAWGEETGDSDYDTDIARELARKAVAQIIARASGFPVDRIVLPLGNDLAHADRTNDGAGGVTRKGTSVDVDGRRARLLRMVRIIMVETIDALRMVAPVDVIPVAGNHDEETILALAEIVSAWYRNDPAVSVDLSPKARKYYRYGTTLIGYTHGHNGKPQDLPLIMATEAPEDWAATTWREWHTAHLHRKSESVQEHSGVRTRVMPSLAPTDAWTASQGYSHQRAAEAYLWSFDAGYVGHFSVGL